MNLTTRYSFLCFFMMLIVAVFFAAPAYAPLMYGPINAQIPCPIDEGFTLVVVTCLQTAIEDATINFLAEFSDAVRPIIMALIAFQITLFGVQALMGVAEIEKKAAALVIKIGAVLLFAQNLGGFAPDVFDIMSEVQEVTVNLIPYGDMECEAEATIAGFIGAGAWVRLDCLLDKLFQFSQPVMLFNAIFALISSALFSGSIGVVVFFMGITALLNVLGFVFYAVYIFIISYLYVGFLIVISPILIPMLLVGINLGIYETWLRNFIAGIAIPMFVFAYLALAMPILDWVIFTDPESLQEVLGDDYALWYRNEQQWCSQQVGTDLDNYSNVPTFGFDHVTGPLKNILTPMMSGNTDYCATFGTSSLDFFEKHVPMMMDVLDALIKLLVVAYLLGTMMKQMPALGASIFGGGFGIVRASQDGLPFSSALRGGLQEAKTSMAQTVGGAKGGVGFLSKGIPGATKGLSGLFK